MNATFKGDWLAREDGDSRVTHSDGTYFYEPKRLLTWSVQTVWGWTIVAVGQTSVANANREPGSPLVGRRLHARQPPWQATKTVFRVLGRFLAEGVKGDDFNRAFTTPSGGQFGALPSDQQNRLLDRGVRL